MTFWKIRRRGLRGFGYRRSNYVIRYIFIIFLILIILPILLHFILPKNENTDIENESIKVNLYLHREKQVVEMGLEDYVVGVVAAEMPASFSIEALKAQAVAARTYVAKKMMDKDNKVKQFASNADISSDHNIHQAWISDEEMKKRWGSWNYQENKEKIVQAVKATRGVVILYNNELIEPLYHASCGGCGTENSEEVWQNKIPYLRRVECSHMEGRKEDSLVYSISDLDRYLGTSLKAVPVANLLNSKKGIVVLDKTSTGRVKSLNIGGKIFSGWDLRSKLSLPSNRFSVSLQENKVVFKTIGYGHGVGMCQYGAQSLANKGKTYEEILTHYYSGVKLGKIK